MLFLEDLADSVGVPKFMIGAIGRCDIIDDCQLLVTLVEPLQVNGLWIPACQLIWTAPSWLAARLLSARVAEDLAARGLKATGPVPPDVSRLHH